MKKTVLFFTLLMLAFTLRPAEANAQKFTHPGLYQTRADLDYMKQQVNAGAEPWKTAFENVKAQSPLDFEIKIERHIIRGPFARPDIGAGDLVRGADMAYRCALIWYITGDQAYADKAMEIIDTWAPNIWDFDENDAKLLVALTGHVWCNAAEILRHTPGSGWTQKNTDDFTHMMVGVYYPVIRYYFPEANGNWDGAMIGSNIAIAVFTDDRAMFDQAVDHYLRGRNNGSMFKYIFPSGQIQESTRDQGHVQMGLREFTGGARIATNQGVNLLDAGDYRLALGYEYTTQFLTGGYPFSYGGPTSERAKGIEGTYDFVYDYFTSQGLEMPYTKKAMEMTKDKPGLRQLIGYSAPKARPAASQGVPQAWTIGFPAGATKEGHNPPNAIVVQPGESLQAAINEAAGTGKWVVAAKGVHTLPESLVIPSKTRLAGQGLETIIHFADNVVRGIVNTDPDLHDVILQDFLIEGDRVVERHNDPNTTRMFMRQPLQPARAGIIFLSNAEGQMKNISFIKLTIQHCTRNAIFVSGAGNVNVIECDVVNNGSAVVPGPRLHHNVLLAHTVDAAIRGCRIVTSPHGCGVNLDHCRSVHITDCEIARNEWYGIRLVTSQNITIDNCLIEANTASGIMSEYLAPGSKDVTVTDNTIWYNAGFGIESYAAENFRATNNRMKENGNGTQEHISDEKKVLMY